MKPITALSASVLLSLALAAPTAQDFTPPGGWDSIDYPELDSYPAPPGGYENVNYPPGTGANPSCSNGPFKFTSTFVVEATPDQVLNGTTPTGGLPGTTGTYSFGLDSTRDLICYHITLRNFRGEYQSPAKTATHLHSGARGQSGPPRIAFPNPTGDGHEKESIGCMTGPFTTGLKGTDGRDTGEGFTVKTLEDAPHAYFADVHSSLAVPGAIRGQVA